MDHALEKARQVLQAQPFSKLIGDWDRQTLIDFALARAIHQFFRLD